MFDGVCHFGLLIVLELQHALRLCVCGLLSLFASICWFIVL